MRSATTASSSNDANAISSRAETTRALNKGIKVNPLSIHTSTSITSSTVERTDATVFCAATNTATAPASRAIVLILTSYVDTSTSYVALDKACDGAWLVGCPPGRHKRVGAGWQLGYEMSLPR